MHRHRYRADIEAIQHTINSLPIAFQRVLNGVGMVSEYSSVWLGLEGMSCAPDGRTCEEASHVFETFGGDIQVVLLHGSAQLADIVVHELGHVFMERVPRTWLPYALWPLTTYAATNYTEAFATAFQAYCTPHKTPDMCDPNDRYDLMVTDPYTFAWFDTLAGK